VRSQRKEVAIPEPLADCSGFGRSCVRGLVVACCIVSRGNGEQEVSLLGAFRSLLLDQTLRSG
jgi:hypothetical protein